MNQIWKSCVSLLFIFSLFGSDVANASHTDAQKQETKSFWSSWKNVILTGGAGAAVLWVIQRGFARNAVAAPANQNMGGAPQGGANLGLGLAGAGVAMLGNEPGADLPGAGDQNFPQSQRLPGAELLPRAPMGVVEAGLEVVGDEHVNLAESEDRREDEDEVEGAGHGFLTPDRSNAPLIAVPTQVDPNEQPAAAQTPSARNFPYQATPMPGSAQLTFRVRVRDSLDFSHRPQLNLDAPDSEVGLGEDDEKDEEDLSDNERARELVESLFNQEEELPVAEQTHHIATPITGRTVTIVFEEMGDDEQHEVVRLLQTPNRDGEYLELQGEEELDVVAAEIPQTAVAHEEPIVLVVEAPANNNAVERTEENAPVQPKTPKPAPRTVRKATKQDRRAAEEARRFMSTMKPRTERKKAAISYKESDDESSHREDDGEFDGLNKKLF